MTREHPTPVMPPAVSRVSLSLKTFSDTLSGCPIGFKQRDSVAQHLRNGHSNIAKQDTTARHGHGPETHCFSSAAQHVHRGFGSSLAPPSPPGSPPAISICVQRGLQRNSSLVVFDPEAAALSKCYRKPVKPQRMRTPLTRLLFRRAPRAPLEAAVRRPVDVKLHFGQEPPGISRAPSALGGSAPQ